MFAKSNIISTGIYVIRRRLLIDLIEQCVEDERYDFVKDILIRYKRMCGYNALWLPGTDHAGIATQIKVEEELRVKEGLTRYDLGREKFLERVWDWKHKFGNRIVEQQKKLGASCEKVNRAYIQCGQGFIGRFKKQGRVNNF